MVFFPGHTAGGKRTRGKPRNTEFRPPETLPAGARPDGVPPNKSPTPGVSATLVPPTLPGPAESDNMPLDTRNSQNGLTGHALRNAHLRQRSVARAQTAPPLARLVVELR